MADSKDTDAAVLPELRVTDKAPESPGYSDTDINEKGELTPGPEALTGHYDPHDGLGDTLYVKGEPVIKDGKDVSRFAVDLRDDGDPPLTFRSFVLGSVFGALGAALDQACSTLRILCLIFIFKQIYTFKPASAGISGVFLQLIIWSFGRAWEYIIPRGSKVQGTRFAGLVPILDFLNPGEFRIKEVNIISL
jgi:hypothetical protein